MSHSVTSIFQSVQIVTFLSTSTPLPIALFLFSPQPAAWSPLLLFLRSVCPTTIAASSSLSSHHWLCEPRTRGTLVWFLAQLALSPVIKWRSGTYTLRVHRGLGFCLLTRVPTSRCCYYLCFVHSVRTSPLLLSSEVVLQEKPAGLQQQAAKTQTQHLHLWQKVTARERGKTWQWEHCCRNAHHPQVIN